MAERDPVTGRWLPGNSGAKAGRLTQLRNAWFCRSTAGSFFVTPQSARQQTVSRYEKSEGIAYCLYLNPGLGAST